MKLKVPHVVVGDNGTFECLHCKAKYTLELPVKLNDFVKKCRAFIELHKDCKQ